MEDRGEKSLKGKCFPLILLGKPANFFGVKLEAKLNFLEIITYI